MKKSLLFLSFSILIIVFILNFLGGKFYLYWTTPGFDKLVHFFASLSVGLFALWVVYLSGVFKKIGPNQRQALLTSLFSVLVIGLIWEFFEYQTGQTQAIGSYPVDTVTDVISDIAGAIAASYVGIRAEFYEPK